MCTYDLNSRYFNLLFINLIFNLWQHLKILEIFAFSAWYKLISLDYFKVFLTVLCRNLNEYFLTSHVHAYQKSYF